MAAEKKECTSKSSIMLITSSMFSLLKKEFKFLILSLLNIGGL